MVIRPYRSADCAILAQIYYDTIHTVNAADYTKAQLDAWASGNVDLTVWNEYFLARHSFVAELGGKIVGFADMDDSGYLGRLYVHHRHQGMALEKPSTKRRRRLWIYPNTPSTPPSPPSPFTKSWATELWKCGRCPVKTSLSPFL